MGVDRVERIDPAMPQPGGICADQVTKGLQLWRAEIQLNHAALTLLLQQTGVLQKRRVSSCPRWSLIGLRAVGTLRALGLRSARATN